MSLLLSNFYPRADAVLTTGAQTINGVKTFNERIVTPEIRGSGLGGLNRRIDLQSGQLYASTSIVSLDYFRRILSGNWQFQFRPTVSGVGVLLQGEAAGGPVTLPSDILFTTGSQTITGPKNFTSRPTFNNLNLITTGDLVNLELNILGLENFVRTTGNQTISGIKNFNSRPTVLGTGVLLQGEIVQSMQDLFNGNRPIKRVPSLSDPQPYGGTTVSGFLENMFFPYIQSTITLVGFSTRTYGYDQVNQLTFAGSINPNPSDDTIVGMQHIFGTTVLSGVSRTTAGSYSTSNVLFTLLAPPPASRTATSSNSFITRLLGTRNGIAFTTDSSPQLLRFEPPYFYGISTNSNLGVNVTGLTPINPSNGLYPGFGINGRPSQINGLQFQFNAQTPNGYIYFAYPDFTNATDSIAAWGLLNSNNGIQDANNFLDYTSTYTNSTVTLNFTHKSNLTYRIYRSPLLSPVTLPTTFTLNFKYV